MRELKKIHDWNPHMAKQVLNKIEWIKKFLQIYKISSNDPHFLKIREFDAIENFQDLYCGILQTLKFIT